MHDYRQIEQISKLIYQKHKTALGIIFQYKPDIASDISDYLQTLIHKDTKLIFDLTAARYITTLLSGLVPVFFQSLTKRHDLFFTCNCIKPFSWNALPSVGNACQSTHHACCCIGISTKAHRL
jgi:hypothetical protein